MTDLTVSVGHVTIYCDDDDDEMNLLSLEIPYLLVLHLQKAKEDETLQLFDTGLTPDLLAD